MGAHVVRTRYIIAEALVQPRTAPAPLPRTLPGHRRPELSSDARVLLFVHGMDSRVEEADALIEALRRIARDTGENWTVVAMDFPTSGYADYLDHRKISPLSSLGSPRHFPPGFDARGRQDTPMLDFMESFTVSFVDTLDRQIPLKRRLEAVIGGSFGGNMTFRLGRRTDLPWLRRVVSWSPASIWTGLADGADIFKQLAVATAWNRAGGDPAEAEEQPETREAFFDNAFGGAISIGPIVIVPSQPDHWYSKDWPCFESSKKGARLDRQEIYNRDFRLWHWRLGGEQLIYSHQKPPHLDEPRYLSNRIPMLLSAGENDDFNFTNLFSAARATAREMVNTPGRAVFFRATGHSIHAERPYAFARVITRFVREVGP